MSTLLQLTIDGKKEFVPPRYNMQMFFEYVEHQNSHLLEPQQHDELLTEFARFVGLKPDQWGMSLGALKWLFKISPDIQRACRQYRADAF